MVDWKRSSSTNRPLVLSHGTTGLLLGSAGVFALVLLLTVGCGANDEGAGSTTPSHDGGGSRTASAPEATPNEPETRAIAGMNAEGVLDTLLKPGLECWHQTQGGTVYACSSEENHGLKPLYEAEIEGGGVDRVSGVEARVFRRGAEDFESASRSFLSFLATQLEYRGADREKAYEFVNRPLGSGETTTTIGTARWVMETTDNSLVLRLTPAR